METRNKTIGIIKGFAVFLVVLGHCMQFGFGSAFQYSDTFINDILYKIIYSFHMPLFMCISGFLFFYTVKTKNILYVFRSKCNGLLIPVLILGMINFVITVLGNKQFNLNIIGYFDKYLGLVITLWFLWAVLINSIIVLAIYKYFNNSIIIYAIIALILLFTPDFAHLSPYKFMYPYFVLSFKYNEYKDIIFPFYKKRYKQINCLLLFLYIALLMLWKKEDLIQYGGFGLTKGVSIISQILLDLHRGIIGLIGSILIINWISRASKLLTQKRKLMNSVQIVGRSSLGIYVIHMVVFCRVLVRLTNGIQFNSITVVIEALLVTISSLCICLLIKKSSIINKLLLGGRQIKK